MSKIQFLSKIHHSRYFAVALGDSESELEFVYGVNHMNKLSKQGFIRLLNICRHRYKSLGEENVLDINKELITLKGTEIS